MIFIMILSVIRCYTWFFSLAKNRFRSHSGKDILKLFANKRNQYLYNISRSSALFWWDSCHTLTHNVMFNFVEYIVSGSIGTFFKVLPPIISDCWTSENTRYRWSVLRDFREQSFYGPCGPCFFFAILLDHTPTVQWWDTQQTTNTFRVYYQLCIVMSFVSILVEAFPFLYSMCKLCNAQSQDKRKGYN